MFFITLWGLRLSVHIGLRHTGVEDFRYQQMRRRWEPKGKLYTFFISYLYVFVMQAAFSVLINASSLYALLNDSKTNSINSVDIIGAGVFTIGFLMEVISDYQLQKFRDRKKPGQILTSGLWRYSRHPNYFGEALLWWGLYIISSNVQKGSLFFFSPLIITLLLRYVSGVPLLERHFAKNPEFQKYMKETSIFIPWFTTN